MVKDIMKYFDMKILLVSLALPIVLNISNMICMLHFFSGYRGFSERLVDSAISSVFYLANWPSILFKIFPYTLSQNGKIDYDMFGMLDLRIEAVNLLGWGLIGLVCGFVIKKYRKQRGQSPS